MKGKALLFIGIFLLLAASASALTPPHPADTNGDGCVNIAEIAAYVKLWKNGFVPMSDVVIGVEVWKLGCNPSTTCNGGLTIYPTNDAYVDSGSPTTNYGSDISLSVDNSPTKKEVYLKFILPTSVYSINNAVLSLNVQSASNADSPNGGTAYLAGNLWTESDLNWNNKPSTSGQGVIQGSVSLGQKVKWDITALIPSNGIFSLAVLPVADNGADYYSSDNTQEVSPKLILDAVLQGTACTTCNDPDNDKYGDPASNICQFSGLDCDNSNPNINPGATEVCNGVDDNCDGTVDEGCNCMTREMVAAERTDCLYIYQNNVFKKGSMSKPHRGNPCGTDVTSVMKSSHIGNPNRYFSPNLVKALCS